MIFFFYSSIFFFFCFDIFLTKKDWPIFYFFFTSASFITIHSCLEYIIWETRTVTHTFKTKNATFYNKKNSNKNSTILKRAIVCINNFQNSAFFTRCYV